MANKRVEFNAVDNGVSQMMQRLRQQSEQMSRDLIQDAQQYTQSGKEQVRYIEDQIKAIERRNQLEKEQRQLVAQQTRQQKEQQATTAGEAQQAREQYQEQIQQIQVESKEDEMQTKLLRELIEVTKQTAQEEIRADKQDTRREIRSTERAMQRGDDVDPEEAFKRAYQKEQLGTEREEVAEEERRFRGSVGQAARGASGVGAGVATSASETAMMAAGLAAIPWVGMGLSRVANQYMQRGGQYEEERVSAQAMMGRDFMGGEGRRQRMLGMTDLGLTGTETYQFGTQLARQRGGARPGMVGESLRDAVSGLTALQELYGVDQQTIMQRAGVERGDVSRQGTFRDIESMVAALQQSGLLEGEDRTRVDELINMQTQFLQQQRQFRETTDAGRVSALMSDMGRVGGGFADDRMIQRMQGMDQALRSPQNQYAEAFQLSTLRQLNPGMNPFELRMEQEKGVMAEDYLNQSMQNIMQMPGADWMKQEQMQNLFGGNLNRQSVLKLFKSFQGDRDLFTDFTERAQELRGQGMGRTEAMKKAEEEALGIRQKQEARTTFSVEEAGEEMFQQIDKMFGDSSPIAGWNDMIKDGIEKMGEFFNTVENERKKLKDADYQFGGVGFNVPFLPDETDSNEN